MVSEVHKHVIVGAAVGTKRAKVHHTSSCTQGKDSMNSVHSPLDHFSFGLSRVAPQHCQEVFGGHTLPETARQKSQIGPENLPRMLVKSTKTHISGVVFGHALVNVRAVGPVYQHPRGGVPRNIKKNNKKQTNKELKMADKT